MSKIVSTIIGTGSPRAIQRNLVRKMAKVEGVSLRTAWRLLQGREDLYNKVKPLEAKKTVQRRRKRRELKKASRRNNR